MQEPVSKELLSKNNELGQYKEVVHEKDVLLKNNRVRIKELEQQVTELEMKNRELENQIKISSMDENEFQKVMKDYDKFIQNIWDQRQELLEENTTLKCHLENIETTFGNVLEKYDKARTVVEGFKENEVTLKNDLDECTQIIGALENKYAILKNYSESKIAEANMEIDNRQRGNLQEVAQLKVKNASEAS
ncbi:hypothetical protein NQ314_021223 [Rhamnusium bicolor]|uniref:Transforming acidic coiled-coil-containing protein C-terminal domain-containing protein n=1 Tax=Rhamnusium bicolor TaxID=1586634 RepID=A0AAV8WIS2_9CUCU|nr:hypothetical protein NQ314_021223 [Rhamnusium bicolor]